MTNKQVVATLDAPAAIGPYSQAIKVGDWLFFSGQLALDAGSGELVAVSWWRGGLPPRPSRL